MQLHEKFYLMVLYGRNIVCVLGKNMYFSVVEFCSVSFNSFSVVKIATYMDVICLVFALNPIQSKLQVVPLYKLCITEIGGKGLIWFSEKYKPRDFCSFPAENNKKNFMQPEIFCSFNLMGYFFRMSRFNISVNAVGLCQPLLTDSNTVVWVYSR